MSLRQNVLKAVIKGGYKTCKEIMGVLGRTISNSKAATRGRSLIKADRKRGRNYANGAKLTTIVKMGKTNLVATVLKQLTYEGKIRKVKRGVYGPPLPKIFKGRKVV